jgi:uncharacterized protein YndB with AHSA1/START domain
VAPADAFRRFTRELDRWWPRHTHSVAGERCEEVVFEEGVGGRIYERAGDQTREWGRVVEWEPPRRVVFTWHPGREPTTAQEVEVTFETVPTGTRVRLIHSGWETLGRAALETRARYEGGWATVLGDFLAAALRRGPLASEEMRA